MADTSNGSRSSLLPWQRHKLLRELAAGERTSAQLARDYGMTAGAVRKFKHDHKAEVDAIAADAANEFAGLWIADKGNRLAAYAAEYDQAADHKNATHHEWIKTRVQILHTVAEELGQLPPRQQITVMPVVHIYEGVDIDVL